MHIHIGKRIIKTAITLFIVLLIYIALLALDNLFQIDHNNFKAPSNMYTPFFAGIAAVYATHQNKKLSIKQAKVRSVGSLVGGYFGMIIVFLYLILFNLIKYVIVSVSIIPLITFTVQIKQVDAVFITCLTFLSVTVSQRNGGMPVFQFATNRVLSTLIGVGVSLFVTAVSRFTIHLSAVAKASRTSLNSSLVWHLSNSSSQSHITDTSPPIASFIATSHKSFSLL